MALLDMCMGERGKPVTATRLTEDHLCRRAVYKIAVERRWLDRQTNGWLLVPHHLCRFSKGTQHEILTVVSTFPPHFYGGGEVSAINQSDWLAKQGHKIGVITTAGMGELELFGRQIDGLHVWRLRPRRLYTYWNHVTGTFVAKTTLASTGSLGSK